MIDINMDFLKNAGNMIKKGFDFPSVWNPFHGLPGKFGMEFAVVIISICVFFYVIFRVWEKTPWTRKGGI